MKLSGYLLLAFLSGAHGFALIAPYLIGVLVLSRMSFRRVPMPVLAPVSNL